MAAPMIEDIDIFLKTSTVCDSTRNLYGHYLVVFTNWIEENNLNPDCIKQINVIDFLNLHPCWNYSTRHNVVAAIRQYFRWRYGDEHQVTRVRIRKVETPPQRTLSSAELLTLISSIDTTSPIGIRNKAIICLMADTGMRASEVCSLEMKHLNIERRSCLVLGKGNRWLSKVFVPFTAEMLGQWLAIRSSQKNIKANTVFISFGGKRPGTPITRHGLHSLCECLASKSGLEQFGPHAMRRTFATLAIENGAPTRLVQLAGGWKNLEMVERYTRALTPDAIRVYSPLDRLKTQQ